MDDSDNTDAETRQRRRFENGRTMQTSGWRVTEMDKRKREKQRQLFVPADAYTTSIKWAEENDVSACEVRVLKKLRDKALKALLLYKKKNKRKLTAF